MKKHLLLVAALALSAMPAFAGKKGGLEILRARYGRDTGVNDVRGVLDNFIACGDLSFTVSPRSMGGDPNPGREDYLYIIYRVNGVEYTDTVPDGKVFTFKGIVGVTPDRPAFGIIPPRAPETARLRVTNDQRYPVLLYTLDEHGRWIWRRDLSPGETYSVAATVGLDWMVTTRANEVLKKWRVRPGTNEIYAKAAPAPIEVKPVPSGEVRVRVENTFGRTVYIYRVNRYGAWDWVASLRDGDIYTTAARTGESWVVTDSNGRILRETRISERAPTIRISLP